MPTWFYDDQTGFQVYRQRIAALSTRWQVVVVVRDARFVPELADLQVRVEVLSARGGSKLAMLRWLVGLVAWIRVRRPALVVLLGAQTVPAAFGLPARCPKVLYWNVHPSQLFDPGATGLRRRWTNALLTRLYYAAVSRVSVTMPIGRALHDDLVDHGIDPRCLVTIPLGVSDRHVAGLSMPPRRLRSGATLRLVMTGSVNAERGRDVMLDAIALLNEDGLPVRLTLVGASEAEIARCRQRIDALGIRGMVEVVGRVSGSRIPAFLEQAHVGLSLVDDRPWFRFNPPTKVYEYLASGLPVIASDIASNRDALEPGLNGWLCRFDAADLASRIRSLLDRPGDVEAASIAARGAGLEAIWSKIEPDFLAWCERACKSAPIGASLDADDGAAPTPTGTARNQTTV